MTRAEEIALSSLKTGVHLRLTPIPKLPNMDRDIRLDGITDFYGEPAVLYNRSETCDGYSIPFSWIRRFLNSFRNRRQSMDKMDENPGYRIKMELANMGPGSSVYRPDWQPAYDFETLDDVIVFLVEHSLAGSVVLNGIIKQDEEKEHGTIADTCWFQVIKHYRDVPDCYYY